MAKKRDPAEKENIDSAERSPSKSREHSVTIENLRTCLDCYRQLRSRGDTYLSQMTELVGCDKATIHRRLQRFEELIQEKGRDDFRLIARGQGTKASAIVDDPVIEQMIGDLAQIVEAWDRLISDWGVKRTIVRLGMSLTAARFFAPFLSREFDDVDFDTTHSRPRRLLELAQRKACDLVMTVIPSDVDPIHDYDETREGALRWNQDMRMKVIAPRGHFTELENWVIKEPKDRVELWNRMAQEKQTLCLLREEPQRYPMTHLPTQELPPQLRVHRVGSSQMLEAMVLSSDPNHQHVTISLPYFFSGEDRERLHIFDAKLDSMRIGLIRPHKEGEKKAENEYRTEKINQIEERIIGELNLLIEREEKPVNQNKHYYHLTKIDGRHIWVVGKVWWQIRTTADTPARGERTVSGRYDIAVNGETHHYLIRGRVLIKKNGQCHLVCRMTSMGEGFIDEFSVSSIFSNEKEMLHGEICGIWTGTTAWNRNSSKIHEDYRGCVVIASSEQDYADLEKIASRYKEMQNIEEPVFTGSGELL